MKISKGANDAGECMVVGCAKRALYRNTGKRGYCRDHKQLVYSAPSRWDEYRQDNVLKGLLRGGQ